MTTAQTNLFQEGTLTVLGARGSAPASGSDFQKFGGHTSSMLARSSHAFVFLDAGTGIVDAGERIVQDKAAPKSIHFFVTHFHWDHVAGLPMFRPLHRPEFHITFHLAPEFLSMGKAAVSGLFAAPYFPVAWEDLVAKIEFQSMAEAVDIDSLTVSRTKLNHPGGATGYRINGPRHSVALITDNEHETEGTPASVVTFCEKVDHLFYDAHFTPDEYEAHSGWGHSTW
ncbi:MAG: MBL fold metallo-hydrolase, partial [Candidatus Eisenbacteria bacterium]|nr:MBL fold metallo-hydrolase [Candidatus Eisenbacteria bacterium]